MIEGSFEGVSDGVSSTGREGSADGRFSGTDDVSSESDTNLDGLVDGTSE